MLTPTQRKIIALKQQVRRHKRRIAQAKLYGIESLMPQWQKKIKKQVIIRYPVEVEVNPEPPPQRRWRFAAPPTPTAPEPLRLMPLPTWNELIGQTAIRQRP